MNKETPYLNYISIFLILCMIILLFFIAPLLTYSITEEISTEAKISNKLLGEILIQENISVQDSEIIHERVNATNFFLYSMPILIFLFLIFSALKYFFPREKTKNIKLDSRLKGRKA